MVLQMVCLFTLFTGNLQRGPSPCSRAGSKDDGLRAAGIHIRYADWSSLAADCGYHLQNQAW